MCVGNEGHEFNDIDLTDLDWTDYDEQADCQVGVFDFKSYID